LDFFLPQIVYLQVLKKVGISNAPYLQKIFFIFDRNEVLFLFAV